MEEINLKNPLVSVCMPAYNAGKYISKAVESILTQSYENWELVIVNDGSTDDTLFELEKFSDERIQVHFQHNKGQCTAANQAFAFSKGSLIKFMDADDIISPDFLKNQVSKLVPNLNCIVYAAWGRFYNNDMNTFSIDFSQVKQDMPPLEWLISSMSSKEVMLQCALWLIPRDLLERAGLWNEDLSLINDFEFFIRVLLTAEELKFVENAILYYRSGIRQSLSSSNSYDAALSAYQSISLGTGHILNQENSQRTNKLSADCFQRFIYSYYPKHNRLIQLAEKKIRHLGGSKLPFPAGGYSLILSRLVGWKATKLLKYLVQ